MPIRPIICKRSMLDEMVLDETIMAYTVVLVSAV